MVPRVSGKDFRNHFSDLSRPAVVVDATSAWVESGRWTPDGLARAFGHENVRVNIADDGLYRYEEVDDPAFAPLYHSSLLCFEDFTRMLAMTDSSSGVYMMQHRLNELGSSLLAKLPAPFPVPADEHLVNLWYGSNTSTQLHFDTAHNVFLQLHGEKTFFIYPPKLTNRLRPYRCDCAMPHLSKVDVVRDGALGQPGSPVTSELAVMLSPGDLLFLPAFWWHQVESPKASISLSYWWPPGIDEYIKAPNAPRALYTAYKADHLVEWSSFFIEPSRSLREVAKLYCSEGNAWGEALFTLAAYRQSWTQRSVSDSKAVASSLEGMRSADAEKATYLESLLRATDGTHIEATAIHAVDTLIDK